MHATNIDFKSLYAKFNHPVTSINCGRKCAPYNENGVPFCCDITLTIPSAYTDEWEYLQINTDLWQPWRCKSSNLSNRLSKETPEDQILIQCLGHHHCQRPYRTIACRSFPFYPYFSKRGEFIGLSYYWQYHEQCWVINHLHRVSVQFRIEFISAFNKIFKYYPLERENYRHQSSVHRRVYGKTKRSIPILHKNGQNYLVSLEDESYEQADFKYLPKYGPYKIAAEMPFPDEKDDEL